MKENLYNKYWEHKHNISEKTILMAEFLLDEADMTFLINYPNEARIFVNGKLYKLYKKPNIENQNVSQLIKLELEQVPFDGITCGV
jgi:hypothetical protein